MVNVSDRPGNDPGHSSGDARSGSSLDADALRAL